MVAEHRLGDQVVHELLRRVLVHRDLLEHDLALGVELLEQRREDHVAHHVERRLEMVVGHAGVDERVLARRRGVQLAAEPVEDLGDLERVEPLAALEQQVLDEVRDARLRRRLVARAGADPVADGDRADVVETLADHPFAGVELAERPVLHGRIVDGDVRLVPCRSRPAGRRRRSLASEDRGKRDKRRKAETGGDAAEDRGQLGLRCDRDGRQDVHPDGAREQGRPEMSQRRVEDARRPGTATARARRRARRARGSVSEGERAADARRSRSRSARGRAPAPAAIAATSQAMPRPSRIGITSSGPAPDRLEPHRGSLGSSDQTSASCRRPWSQIERRSRPSSWKPQRSATCCDGTFSGCVRISIRPTPASNSQRADEPHRARDETPATPGLAGEVRQLPVVARALRRDDGARPRCRSRR